MGTFHIEVPQFEVELSTHNPADPETWLTVMAPLGVTQRAYEIMSELYAETIEGIMRGLIEGKIT